MNPGPVMLRVAAGALAGLPETAILYGLPVLSKGRMKIEDVSRSRLWASGISLTNFLVVKSNPIRFPSEFSISTLASVSREICTVREAVWLIEVTFGSGRPLEMIDGLDMFETSKIAPTIKPVIKRVVNISMRTLFVARALDWSASVLVCPSTSLMQ